MDRLGKHLRIAAALVLPALSGVAAASDEPVRLTPKPAYLGQPPAPAEAFAGSDAELAKKLSNPVADLISIPFQLNYDQGYGPKDADILRLNVQPVIPLTLNDDWNLITRTIVSVIYQDSLAEGVDSGFGLGDTVQSFFFSPKQPTNGWIWGAGPAFNWPTATDDQLGTRKWGAGPTAVLLKQDGGRGSRSRFCCQSRLQDLDIYDMANGLLKHEAHKEK